MIDNFIIDLVVTENCNLKCKYCYETQRNINMTEENFDHFYSVTLPQLKKLYDFNTYSLHFFGGEPLLNFNLIKYVVPIIKKDNNCIEIGIVSNGLLYNEEIKNYCNENNINFSISFDGLGNKFNRVDINNQSTYDKYKNNKTFTDTCKYAHLTIDPNTAPILDEIMIDLVENWNIYGIDFSLVRDDVWTKEDIINYKNMIDRLGDKWVEYIEKGIPIGGGLFTLSIKEYLNFKINNYKRNFSCFSGYNGVAIMPNCDVYPCTRYGSNRELPIIENDIINYDNYEFFQQEILNPKEIKKCKECVLYNYCNTGCKYSQIKNNYEPIDSICTLYKINFKKAFEIHNKLKDNQLWLNSIQL